MRNQDNLTLENVFFLCIQQNGVELKCLISLISLRAQIILLVMRYKRQVDSKRDVDFGNFPLKGYILSASKLTI